jgi:hypothetical protein
MRAMPHYAENRAPLRAIRRCVEYAVTVGLALLSSYWIVYGR